MSVGSGLAVSGIVYRIPKGAGPDRQPGFVVIKAADEFHEKTTRPNQLWKTDFTYLKVVGWPDGGTSV